MQSKYYYKYPSEIIPLESAVADYWKKKEKDKSLKFVVLMDKKFLFDETFMLEYKKVVEYLKSHDIDPYEIGFSINDQQRRFSSEEWTILKKYDVFFKKQGISFGFEDMERTWGVQEVEIANKKIVQTADEIRKQDLSPYEKILMAYLKVTSRKYTKEDEGAHYSSSRSVFGVLNDDNIVCVGYSEWLKSIAKELGDENIKIYRNSVKTSRDGKTFNAGHSNLIIRIKDEKYGIDGYYYLDPTWDSGHEEGKYVPDITYFMVPLSDIDKIRYQIRGAWSGLQSEYEPQKQTSTKKDNNSYTVYNWGIEATVSFTSDGFQITEELFKDIIKENPEFAQLIKDEIIGEQYLRLIGECDDLRKQQNSLRELLSIVEKSSILGVERKDLSIFKDIVDECVASGEYEKLTTFLADIEAKQAEQDLCGDFIKGFEDYLDKFYADDRKEVLELTNKLSRESYNEFIQKELNARKEINPDIDEERLRKSLMEEYSYETYKADNERMLEMTKDSLKATDDRINEFLAKLKTEIAKDPNLKYKLMTASESYLQNLYNEFGYPATREYEDIDFYIEWIISRINSLKTVSITSDLKSKIATLEATELRKIQMLEDLDNKSIEECIDEFFFQHSGRGKSIDEWFKKQSIPIELNKTTNALREILTKTQKNMSQQDIYDYIRQLVDFNCEEIPNCFEKTASNALVQRAIQLREERELNA